MELFTMSNNELSNVQSANFPSPALPQAPRLPDDRQGRRQEPSTLQPSTYWHNRRVIVTGGAGFLGSFVLEKLNRRGAAEIFVPRIDDYNLVELGDIQRMFDDALPSPASSPDCRQARQVPQARQDHDLACRSDRRQVRQGLPEGADYGGWQIAN
jgi:hypothetical protein